MAGCAGDPVVPLRTASSLEHDLDSVITACSISLRARPDDAGTLARLAGAVLDRTVIRETDFRNMAWWGPGMQLSLLKNVGRRLDRASVMSPRDTLRAAASNLERAITLERKNAAAWRMLGRLYMALGAGYNGDSMYAKATAAFDTSLLVDPSSAEGYYGLGCSLLKTNRSVRALDALNKSILYDSLNARAYLALGEAFLDTGNVTVAYACFENAGRLGLTYAHEYLQLAGHYDDEASERKLLGRFASLRKQVPPLVKPTVRSALRAVSLYHPAIVRDFASRALAIDSTCADARLMIAQVDIEEGDTASALDEYLQAFDLGTAGCGAYVRFPREFLDRVYERMPDNDALMYLLGLPYLTSYQRASSPDAVERFQKAALRRPGSVVPAFLTGQAYANRADTAKAVEWFEKALSLPPANYPSLYWTIQYTFVNLGQPERAVETFRRHLLEDEAGWIPELMHNEKASRRYSNEQLRLASAYCAVGYECSWRSGSPSGAYWKKEALGMFTRASRIVPESSVPWYGLGAVYLDAGDAEGARRYFQKAAAMGSTDARSMLKKLPSPGK